MVGAIAGSESVVFFRPITAAASVGEGSVAQKREAGVLDSNGRSLSKDASSSELTLSREKRELLARLRGEQTALEDELMRSWSNEGSQSEAAAQNGASQTGVDALGLSESEAALVDSLKERDNEVRAHEQAHAVVGGSFAGAPTYEYQIGPDGQRYAIGGEVKIDVSPVSGDPEATIAKMRQVERAALAPAEPSPQDRAVAEQARDLARAAEADLADQTEAERGVSIRSPQSADERQQTRQAELIRQASESYAQSRAAQTPTEASRFMIAA